MAASPKYKVYADGEYVASVKYAEDAAAIVAFRGEGTTIRYSHGATLWTEGKESFSAAESYDRTAVVIWQREREMHQKYHDRVYEAQARFAQANNGIGAP